MIIYQITNSINSKVYVGQTTRPISHRWKQHLRDAKELNYPLYRAIRKQSISSVSKKLGIKY